MQIYKTADFSNIYDRDSSGLMPSFFEETTNSDEVILCKYALKEAMEQFLTARQKQMLEAHYWLGKRKTEIAQDFGVAPSTVVKQIQSAERVIKDQVRYALSSYQRYKREELRF